MESLKLELKNLLEEHNRLKQKLSLSDAEFKDLNLQNKVVSKIFFLWLLNFFIELYQYLLSLLYLACFY